MRRTILLLTIIGLGTAATAMAPGKLFAQGAGGSGGGSAGGSSGLGGSALGGATGAGLSGTPGAGSGLGSGLRGGASGSGQAGPGAAAPAPRPPLGSPNVGNIGAPTMIDPASQPAALRGASVPSPSPMTPAGTSTGTKNPNTFNSANPAGRAMGRLVGDWRYVYRNGRHWYWMPNRTWQLWNGSSWQPYAPGMQSRTAAANELPRRMSGYRGAGGAGAYGDNTQATNASAATTGETKVGSGTNTSVTRPSTPTGDDALKEIPDASGVTVP